MNKFGIATILLAAMLSIPTVGASWRSYGNQEPDSVYDNPTLMWFDAPAAGESKVYFNTFMTNGFFAQDSSTTGSRIDNYGLFTFLAILGPWVDCNGDGYVGLAETAMLEYPSTVLSTVDSVPAACADGGAHNKGGWVTELLPIGAAAQVPNQSAGIPLADDGCPDGAAPSCHDDRVINDAGAAVWGDLGLATAAVRGSCAVSPMESQALHTTGGILDYVDCIGANFIADKFNLVAGASGGNIAPVASDHRKTTWAESAYSFKTFGEDSTSNSAVTYSDCTNGPADGGLLGSTIKSQGLAATIGPVIGEPSANINSNWGPRGPSGAPGVNPPQPSASTPGNWGGGNAPGTVNYTWERTAGDCNTANDQGNDFYSCMSHTSTGSHPCEGNNNGNSAVGGASKDHSDFVFSFSPSHRSMIADGAPSDLGLYLVGALECTVICTTDASGNVFNEYQNAWVSQVQYISDFRPFNGPRTGPAVGQFRDASFYSFYAKLGSVGLASGATPGGTGVYGAEKCPTIGAGAASLYGWKCDPAGWNPPSVGNQRFHFGTVGDVYNFRDIDCDDGTVVRGLPVYAGTGGVAAINCDTPKP